jgi:CBS domain-containing protein
VDRYRPEREKFAGNPGLALDGVREVRGAVFGRTHGAAWRGRDLLSHTLLSCQIGGTCRSAVHCLSCPRFVNYRPTADRAAVLIRCQWNHDDLVCDLMTRAGSLHTVAPDTPIAVADDIAVAAGVRHLIVANQGNVAGLVCRCDLIEPAAAGETVANRMSRSVWTLKANATLTDAAALMAREQVGCLPIVEDGVLLGVVTRGDLRRTGVAEDCLGAHACEACGSLRGVRPHPGLDAVELCLECIERALTPPDPLELGGGD